MYCPYCQSPDTNVTNSRLTRKNTQVWRRRRCLKCREIFTTHEVIDLSHLTVLKKSGKVQSFHHAKLYSGIYGVIIGLKIPNRETMVDGVTRSVETKLLTLKQKQISSDGIADIVLQELRGMHIAIFMRYLTFCKDITT